MSFPVSPVVPAFAETPSSTEPSQPSPSDQADKPSPGRRKLIRLSLACNQCRKRKVRCDAKLPKCRNCTERGEVCETTNPRRPGQGPAVRRRASRAGIPGYSQDDLDEDGTPVTTSSWSPGQAGSIDSPGSTDRGLGRGAAPEHARQASNAPTSKEWRASEDISWVERGYHESLEAQPHSNPQEYELRATEAAPGDVVNIDDTTYKRKVNNLGAVGKFNVLPPTPLVADYKTQFMGGSSLQSFFSFVDLHFRQRQYPPASHLFRHGMRHSEEFPVLPKHDFKGFPSQSLLNSAVNSYFDSIWPLFPVVDRPALEADMARFSALQDAVAEGLPRVLTPPQIPSLAMVYAIYCIGSNEALGAASETSKICLSACYELYPFLVGMPYLSSVQALFLLALALRGQARDGQAWHVTGHAIRMAQSLGLHKQSFGWPSTLTATEAQRSNGNDPGLHRRIWWSCYAFEKLIHLESGRPSILSGEMDDRGMQPLPTYAEESPDCFSAWVSLSIIMGRIAERLYARRLHNSTEMFAEAAALDQALVDWQNNLPDTLKQWNSGPTGDGLDHDGDGRQDTSIVFLSLQFYHAQIAVLRVSLLYPQQHYIAEVKKHGPESTARARLLRGAFICASAARNTITQTLHLADHGIKSALIGANQPFSATVVLALGILHDPGRLMARADMELLNASLAYIEDFYARWGVDPEFIRVCAVLRDRMASIFNGAGSEEQRPTGQSGGRIPASVNADQISPSATSLNWIGGVPDNTGMHGPAAIGLFDDIDFGDFWSLMESDFTIG